MLPAEQTAKAVRCAIYTRTSSEEGLSQEFNSLDAQRECGEAYIRSQRQAGWTLLPARYDDGGFTGANLERPALERLLADMRAGAIDCVVLYKVDRLSRSLFDFARLMQMFEEQGVSFVSVTQQFNSSTPMGRLTLHVLLSFAQFEREMVSERTRDKKGAARRKGKWMGGTPMLGYDVDGQSRLQVNEAEAAQVREIFALFVGNGSLEETLEEMAGRGWRRKRWTTRQGKEKGGRAFDRGSLVRLLRNVVYRGQVQHKGKVYRGEQAAIVEPEMWKQAQEGLRRQRKAVRRRGAGSRCGRSRRRSGNRSRADGGSAGGAGAADQPADGVGGADGRVGARRAGEGLCGVGAVGRGVAGAGDAGIESAEFGTGDPGAAAVSGGGGGSDP